MYDVTTGILSVAKAQRLGLKRISAEGIFLEPGEMAVMDIDGNPLIISTAGKKMLAVHAERVSDVDTIIAKLRGWSIPPFGITMRIQLHVPRQESEFVKKAWQLGLHVQVSYPIAEFLALLGAQIGGENLVAIQRNK